VPAGARLFCLPRCPRWLHTTIVGLSSAPAPDSTKLRPAWNLLLHNQNPAPQPKQIRHAAALPTHPPQVIVGFVRPAPDAKIRGTWNLVHHNLGRVSILASWVTIYLGIYIAHGSRTFNYSYSVWIVAMAVSGQQWFRQGPRQ
jgi:hypothetical protein